MSLPSTLRPGIFTQVTVTPLYATPRGRLWCGVVGVGASQKGELLRLENYRQAAAALTGAGDAALLGLLAALFAQGVAGACCIPVGGAKEEYLAAFAKLEEQEEIGAVVTDSGEEAVLRGLKESVERSALVQRERLALAGVGEPEGALTLAKALDSERFLLCCGSGEMGELTGPALLAAGLAGVILGADDPAVNLGGAPLGGLTGLLRAMTASEVETLLLGGVIPFEKVAGQVECIRGVTTRTTTGGVGDTTYRSVNTILIIDHLMATVRGALRSRLRGSRNNPQTRESIGSQVTVELEKAMTEGLLESYSTPRVYPHSEDAGVCVVELAFTVAQVINQIVVVAQIRV